MFSPLLAMDNQLQKNPVPIQQSSRSEQGRVKTNASPEPDYSGRLAKSA